MQFSDYDIECLNKVKEMIDQDISRHFTISTLAGKSGMGSTRLKEGFKTFFGLPIYKYLKQQRLIRSKELLLDTHLPIKNIAKRCGYNYYRNFIVSFTLYFHVTPHKMRKSAQGK